MPKIQYPILSKRKIGRFVRRFAIPGEFDIKSIKANKGKVALDLTFSMKEDIDPSGVDDLLNDCFGFEPNHCGVLDELYGSMCKYYRFEYRGGLWVAIGDNHYGDNASLYLEWDKKLDRETRDSLY